MSAPKVPPKDGSDMPPPTLPTEKKAVAEWVVGAKEVSERVSEATAGTSSRIGVTVSKEGVEALQKKSVTELTSIISEMDVDKVIDVLSYIGSEKEDAEKWAAVLFALKADKFVAVLSEIKSKTIFYISEGDEKGHISIGVSNSLCKAVDILKVRNIFEKTLKSKMKKKGEDAVKLSRRTVKEEHCVELDFSYFITSQGKISRQMEHDIGCETGEDGSFQRIDRTLVGEGGVKSVYKLESVEGKADEMVRGVDNLGSDYSRVIEACKELKGIRHLMPGHYLTYTSAKTGKKKQVFLAKRMSCDFRDICSMETIPDKVKLKAVLQVSKALKAMHDRGWSHGDIKNANILLRYNWSRPENIEAALADFDLARKYKEDETLVSRGTPYNMAPELFSKVGVKGPDAAKKIDVWSLGITIWCIMKGEKDPWWKDAEGVKNIPQLASYISERGDEGIDKHFPERSDETSWQSVCRKMVRIDPSERMSMDDAIKALEKLI
jgi:hypothetical protein